MIIYLSDSNDFWKFYDGFVTAYCTNDDDVVLLCNILDRRQAPLQDAIEFISSTYK